MADIDRRLRQFSRDCRGQLAHQAMVVLAAAALVIVVMTRLSEPLYQLFVALSTR